MSSIESKRVQYRKYLERAGVIDALSRALIKLYEESDKPDDAIRYVRKFMCESCPDDAQYDMMKADLQEATKNIVRLEQELERMRSQIKRSPEEIAQLLEEGFASLMEDDTETSMLLKKYLTREVLDEYMATFTEKEQANLYDCVVAGLENHNATIGVFAPDLESYDTYPHLFDPILKDYHRIVMPELEEGEELPKLAKDLDWGNPDEVENLDPERKYILWVRMMLARNLEDYPFFNKLKEEQFVEIEELVKTAALGLDGEISGAYYSINELDIEVQNEMIHRKVLFKRGDEVLTSAGCYRFWPNGRGIFHNNSDTFFIWVNEQDHLKLTSFANCGDMGDVYQRLLAGYNELEKTLKFLQHPNYGYLSANPEYVGTGLKIAMQLRVPLLARDLERLNGLENSLAINIKSNHYTPELDETVIEIWSIQSLGVTEQEIVQKMKSAALAIIQNEEEIAAADE